MDASVKTDCLHQVAPETQASQRQYCVRGRVCKSITLAHCCYPSHSCSLSHRRTVRHTLRPSGHSSLQPSSLLPAPLRASPRYDTNFRVNHVAVLRRDTRCSCPSAIMREGQAYSLARSFLTCCTSSIFPLHGNPPTTRRPAMALVDLALNGGCVVFPSTSCEYHAIEKARAPKHLALWPLLAL